VGVESEDRMNNKELTDTIYATLMQKKNHKQLDISKIENPVVERKRGWITFDYGDTIVMLNVISYRK